MALINIINTTPTGTFLNTTNNNAGTFPGTSGALYYGLYISKGLISLVDGSSPAVNILSLNQPLDVTAKYTTTVAEVDAVLTYTEDATLTANTTYYFSIQQLIPGYAVPNQYLTQLIQYTTPLTGTPSKGSVATGLAAILNGLEGFKLTTSVNTGAGTLAITASAGYPILTGNNVDSSGATLVQTTTGIQSVGQKADLTNSVYGTNTNWVSTNTYDMFNIQWKTISNGITNQYSATILINTGATSYAEIKSFLQGGNTQSLFNYDGTSTSSAWLAVAKSLSRE